MRSLIPRNVVGRGSRTRSLMEPEQSLYRRWLKTFGQFDHLFRSPSNCTIFRMTVVDSRCSDHSP